MALKAQRRARRLSLTSLIDVIFLLLLFFMLTSKFSRHAEIELSAAGAAGAADAGERQVFFLRLTREGATLNSRSLELSSLAATVEETMDEGLAALLVSVGAEVTAQTLADALVAARDLPEVPVTVLEGS
jgi:biopolymer transport protein ExbD